MPTSRLPNWDAELVRFARAELGQPWAWGHRDCASLIRRGLEAMYGAEIWPGPHWDSRSSAIGALRDHGGVLAVLLRDLGAETVPVPFARTGDVLVAPAAEDDVTDNAWLLVTGHLLGVNPGDTVRLWPLEECPPEALALRVPAVLGGADE